MWQAGFSDSVPLLAGIFAGDDFCCYLWSLGASIGISMNRSGGGTMEDLAVKESVWVPTSKEILEIRAVLKKRKQPVYPEIQQFIRRKRKEESKQVNFSLAIG